MAGSRGQEKGASEEAQMKELPCVCEPGIPELAGRVLWVGRRGDLKGECFQSGEGN